MNLFIFIKKKITYSAAMIFEKTVNFLLFPVYTHVLLPHEYGIYALTLTFISIAVFLYSLGIENGLLRYQNTDDDPGDLYSTIFWGAVLLAGIFSIAVYFFSNQIAAALFRDASYSLLIKFASGILFCDTIIRFFLYNIIGKQKSGVYMVINLVRGSLTLFLNLYFILILKMGLTGIFLSYLSASLITLLFAFIFSFKSIKLYFNRRLFKRVIFFGFPLMLNSVFITLLNFFDRYMLGLFHNTAVVGTYSAAYKFGLIINIVITAFYMTGIPFTAKVLSEDNSQKKIFSNLFSLLSVTMITIATFLILFLQNIVRIRISGFTLIHDNYYASLDIVPLILSGYLFYGFYAAFSLGIFYKEKTRILPFISAAGFLINFILNLIFIPQYAGMGAALSTLISFAAMAVIMFIYSKNLLKIDYRLKEISILVLVSLGLCVCDILFLKNMIMMKFVFFLLFLTGSIFYIRKSYQ